MSPGLCTSLPHAVIAERDSRCILILSPTSRSLLRCRAEGLLGLYCGFLLSIVIPTCMRVLTPCATGRRGCWGCTAALGCQ